MPLNETEAAIVEAAAKCLEVNYLDAHEKRHAEALRSILPKPRYWAQGRSVWMRTWPGNDTLVADVQRRFIPDDAAAWRIAEMWAEALNKETKG